MRPRRTGRVAASILALALGGCGSESTPTSTPEPEVERPAKPVREERSRKGGGHDKKDKGDSLAAPAFEPDPDHPLRELAAHWAPLIENDTSRPDYRPDFITRADYDGDWDLTNNYDQRNEFDQPAWAYWWATQTPTHAFLGYAFYRVATEAGTLSENEMTGLVLAIRLAPESDGADPRFPGRFEAMLVWSQGRDQAYTANGPPPPDPELGALWSRHLKPAGPITAQANTTVGNVNFVLDAYGLHPVLYSTEDHHALSAGPPDRTDGVGKFRVSITDWRGKDYGARQATAGDSWGEYRGDPQDGVVYAYSGEARLAVVGDTGKGRGRYKHHWEIVGYDLVSLASLWQKRKDRGVFVDYGIFVGSGPRGVANRAPWAWTGGDDRPDPFRDPGGLVASLVDLPPPFDPAPVSRHPEFD